jgi:hypothetical protein
MIDESGMPWSRSPMVLMQGDGQVGPASASLNLKLADVEQPRSCGAPVDLRFSCMALWPSFGRSEWSHGLDLGDWKDDLKLIQDSS